MEPPIPIHTLVKLVDAEKITNEKIPALDLPMEISNLTSKVESQNIFAETYDPNSKSCLHKYLIETSKVNLNFWKTVLFVINQICLFQVVFVNTAKMKKKNGILILDWNPLRKLLIIIVKHTRINFIDVNNLHPTLLTNTYSLFKIHEIVQLQEIDILHIDPPVKDHFHFHGYHLRIFVFDIVITIENSIPIEHHHLQDRPNL